MSSEHLIREAREWASSSPLGKITAREVDRGILFARRLADALEDAVKEARMRRAESADFERERDEADARAEAAEQTATNLAAPTHVTREAFFDVLRQRDAAESKIQRALAWRDPAYEGELGKRDDYAQGYQMALRNVRRILTEGREK